MERGYGGSRSERDRREKGGRVMVRDQRGVGRLGVDASRDWTTTASDGDAGDSDPFSMLEAAESTSSLWERMLEELPPAEPKSRTEGSPAGPGKECAPG